jgi:hypothetical protein
LYFFFFWNLERLLDIAEWNMCALTLSSVVDELRVSANSVGAA